MDEEHGPTIKKKLESEVESKRYRTMDSVATYTSKNTSSNCITNLDEGIVLAADNSNNDVNIGLNDNVIKYLRKLSGKGDKIAEDAKILLFSQNNKILQL